MMRAGLYKQHWALIRDARRGYCAARKKRSNYWSSRACGRRRRRHGRSRDGRAPGRFAAARHYTWGSIPPAGPASLPLSTPRPLPRYAGGLIDGMPLHSIVLLSWPKQYLARHSFIRGLPVTSGSVAFAWHARLPYSCLQPAPPPRHAISPCGRCRPGAPP